MPTISLAFDPAAILSVVNWVDAIGKERLTLSSSVNAILKSAGGKWIRLSVDLNDL